jgi:hypothetical protein
MTTLVDGVTRAQFGHVSPQISIGLLNNLAVDLTLISQ